MTLKIQVMSLRLGFQEEAMPFASINHSVSNVTLTGCPKPVKEEGTA
jgi:hypothetical protein